MGIGTRLASGGYSYKIEEWSNSAAAERALGSLDPPACSSRPRLKAPAEWIHGERLKFDENLSPLIKEREVRLRRAKQQLHAVQKANRQIVARAEQQQPRNADQKREVQIADAERKRTQRSKRKLPLPLLPSRFA